MRAGAGLMQIEAGIPVELVDVLQAIILLFLAAESSSGTVFRHPGGRGRRRPRDRHQLVRRAGR